MSRTNRELATEAVADEFDDLELSKRLEIAALFLPTSYSKYGFVADEAADFALHMADTLLARSGWTERRRVVWARELESMRAALAGLEALGQGFMAPDSEEVQ